MDLEWVSVKEIAEGLKVHTGTVYRWIKEGRLRAIKPGGRIVRIRLSDFILFLQENLPDDSEG